MDYTGRIVTKNQVVPTASSAPGIWTLDEAMQYTKQGKWPPGYQISRSVRLRSSASAYFNRTPASAGNRRTWTWSGWVKLGSLSTTLNLMYAYSADSDSGLCQLSFQSNQLRIQGFTASFTMVSTPVYRDPSAWYHIVYKVDTTQATAADRVRVYVNGVEITAWATNTPPPQNTDTAVNNNVAHNIGRNTRNSNDYFDGYFAEVNFIDGQALTPASFGYTDTATGVWQPAPYNGTYGTNGFYLNFKDPTSTTTIAYDYSGNSNNFTANNISVTAGSTYDSMVDVPINYGNDTGVGGEVRGNYVVLNAVDAATAPSDGNLRLVSGNANYGVRSTIQLPSSGKWYAECIFGTTTSANVGLQFGFATASASLTNGPSTSGKYGIYADTIGYIFSNTTTLTSGLGVISSGTVLQIAYDGATGNAWVGKTNVWYNSSGGTTGDPATGANPTFTSLSSVFVYVQGINGTQNFNAGQTAFSYTAPSGYQALCTQNLPTPTISNGANYMAASLYTGNGGTLTVSNGANNTIGTTFQPDMVWIKSRSAATNNKLTDSVRGATKAVISNTSGAETTDTNGLTAFGSSGFTVGTDTVYNNSGATYVGWNWKGGGTAVTNNDGNRTASVSANTTAGFSVVTYTFSTSATNTIGHGLGVAPSMLLSRNRTVANNWDVYHISLGYTQRLILNDTGAASGGGWAATPTSTVFSVTTGLYLNNDNIVTYCFSPITGYSAFGSYTGNGSTDGPFIYLGFRPRYILIKRSDSTGSWYVWDTSRSPYNQATLALYPNLADAEPGGDDIDFLSNGFKMRDTFSYLNASGGAYIYAAFAENPFTLARAR